MEEGVEALPAVPEGDPRTLAFAQAALTESVPGEEGDQFVYGLGSEVDPIAAGGDDPLRPRQGLQSGDGRGQAMAIGLCIPFAPGIARLDRLAVRQVGRVVEGEGFRSEPVPRSGAGGCPPAYPSLGMDAHEVRACGAQDLPWAQDRIGKPVGIRQAPSEDLPGGFACGGQGLVGVLRQQSGFSSGHAQCSGSQVRIAGLIPGGLEGRGERPAIPEVFDPGSRLLDMADLPDLAVVEAQEVARFPREVQSQGLPGQEFPEQARAGLFETALERIHGTHASPPKMSTSRNAQTGLAWPTVIT